MTGAYDLDPLTGHDAQVERVLSLLVMVRELGVSLDLGTSQLRREIHQLLDVQPARDTAPVRVPSDELETARLAAANRAVIEQAKGMLMLLGRCDADAAFARLSEVSQRERRKVRDIAGEFVAVVSQGPEAVLDLLRRHDLTDILPAGPGWGRPPRPRNMLDTRRRGT
jgi:hypothetical protein